MILSLCQELRELFVAEESCLSDIDSDEDGFEDSRPRDRQISVEYDPDTDDYEMQVSPELPEVIDLKETQLIVKQIAQLETRIDQGGDAQIISHYRKAGGLCEEFEPDELMGKAAVTMTDPQSGEEMTIEEADPFFGLRKLLEEYEAEFEEDDEELEPSNEVQVASNLEDIIQNEAEVLAAELQELEETGEVDPAVLESLEEGVERAAESLITMREARTKINEIKKDRGFGGKGSSHSASPKSKMTRNQDPLLTGMLAARAGKGLASKLKREALVEAQKDAKKEIEAGKQVEAVNSSDQESTCDTDLVSMGFPAEANDECEQSDAALEDVSFLAPADLRWFKDAEGMPTMTI
eukprot:g13673.t1